MTSVASVLQQQKKAGLLRVAFTTLNPVWAGAHDLEFEVEVEVEANLKAA